ncbi:MAG TPA: phosphatase PAP2 family protein, partial [Candidatus Faecousia intestinavium]|nr:phosphatase PAP2 family protein [Candidatus Faecousia intestinavium]
MAFDLPILDWIQANLKSDLLDTLMPIITLFGDGGVFWIAIAVLLLCIPKTRKIGLGMGFALLMGLVVCNITLKPLVGRIRPYDLQEQLGVTIPLLTDRMHDYSFPSGHTIASFEASVVLLKNNKWMGIPAVILAVLIAFSRLYLYVHYPTDVIFSVFAGILFAFLGDALANKVVTR